jgi:hypothetical protein
MNIRLITRVMMLATATAMASSVLMAAAQAEVKEAKKARAAAFLSAHAQPAQTFVPALAQAQPSAMRYVGGPKSPILVVTR